MFIKISSKGVFITYSSDLCFSFYRLSHACFSLSFSVFDCCVTFCGYHNTHIHSHPPSPSSAFLELVNLLPQLHVLKLKQNPCIFLGHRVFVLCLWGSSKGLEEGKSSLGKAAGLGPRPRRSEAHVSISAHTLCQAWSH